MRLRTRTTALACAAVLGLTGLALPTTASGALLTSKVIVSATQPPAGLLPGNSATSTVTVANTGKTTVARTRVTVTPPASSAKAPTFAVSPAPGVTCAPLRAGSTVQLCTVGTLTPGYSETVATITGTPPSNIGSGVSASVKVAGPANTVAVTWHWGLPRLVTRVLLSPSSIELGQSITGTLTVTNAGNGTAPGFITDTPLPGGLDTLISQTPGTSCIPYDTDLWCPMGGLPPGASNTVVWSFEPQTGGGASYKVTSSADISSVVPQPTRAGDVATSNPVTVLGTGARLAVAASNSNPLPQGSNFERTVTVTNTGDTPAYNTTIQDWTYGTFPYLGTVNDGTCAVFYTSTGGRSPRQILAGEACTLGTVPAGGSLSVTYKLEASPTVSPMTYTSSLRAGTSTPQSTVTSSNASIIIVVPTSPVAPALLSPPAAPSGNAVVGDGLTAATGSWNGTPPIGLSYAWSDCDTSGTTCHAINGAIGPTYTVQSTDVGSTIEATVTASNGGGSASATSPPTPAVIPAQKPTIATAPVVTPLGEPAVGITYDTTAGIWNGTPTISYAYQWYDCNSTGTTCSPVSGATGTSYVSTSSDLGSYLEVIVTATNSGGTSHAASNLAPTSD